MNTKTPTMRLIVIPMVCLTLAGVGTPAGLTSVRAATQAQLASPTAAQLAAAVRAAETIGREIPRETFDPKAVSESLGRDPQKIFDWVRDRTYWVPYRGALRGPVGVLMDRLGNSLDRSLLLAELLREAGRTVRLAHATLPGPRANQALAKLVPPPNDPQPANTRSGEDADGRMARVAAAFGMDADRLRADTRQASAQADSVARELSARLAAQGPFLANDVGGPDTSSDDAKALESLADHWWTQVQDGNRWIDFDVILARAGVVGVEPQPDRTVAFDQPTGRIPLADEDSHTVAIRVIVEQWAGGRLIEKTVLDHRLRPAEVFGQPISLLHLPTAWPAMPTLLGSADASAAVKAAALKQTEWIPILQVGEKSIVQKSFRDSGELNDSPSNKASATGGGSPRSPLSGFGGFGGLGGDEPDVATGGHLTAEWIEYEIRVPGERPRKIRRQVFDVLTAPRTGQSIAEPAANEATRTERALAAVGTIDILPLVSRLSRPYVQALVLSELSKNGRALTTREERRLAGNKAGAAEEAGRIQTTNDLLLKLAMARLDWNPYHADVYLDAPNILTYHRMLKGEGATAMVVREGFDIVANHVGVTSTSLLTPFATRVAQGIVDTNAEELLMGDASQDNAGGLLAAMPAATQWVTMRNAADLTRSTGTWPVQMRRHAATAISAGLVVMAPRQARPGGTAAPRAFWTIDPSSGDTLGIGDAGWGQITIEYAAGVWFVSGIAVIAGLCELILPSSRRVGSWQICLNPGGLLIAVVLNLTASTLSVSPPPGPSGPPSRPSGGWRRRK